MVEKFVGPAVGVVETVDAIIEDVTVSCAHVCVINVQQQDVCDGYEANLPAYRACKVRLRGKSNSSNCFRAALTACKFLDTPHSWMADKPYMIPTYITIGHGAVI